MNVIAAASRRKEMTYMKTFTIDIDNGISAFATLEEAAAALTTPFESFASQKELAALAAKWPEERLVEIWNGLPGVEPVKSFKSAKTAAAARMRAWGMTDEGTPGRDSTREGLLYPVETVLAPVELAIDEHGRHAEHATLDRAGRARA